MKALLKGISWAEKPKLSKEVILILVVGAIAVLTFFKLKPYFEESPKVVTAPHHEAKVTGVASLLEHLSVGGSGSAKDDPLRKSGEGRGAPQSLDRRGPGIIERPLFDGLTVTLKAVLLNAVSSHQMDAPVEATILHVDRAEGATEFDGTPAQGAKLIGLMAMNLPMKRLGFTFSEMVGREGRSYPVAANAFDRETRTMGIAANYSSGLGSRLLGVGLDQAINLANQVAMAKVLENSTSNSEVAQEMQAASILVSQQASNGISAEATRDLRETPPELSLPAGTEISVRLRALPGQTGGRP